MKRLFILICIIAVAACSASVSSSIAYQKGTHAGYENGHASSETEKQVKLDGCLSDAKDKYDASAKLNSTPKPTKEYPSAFVWNNDTIMRQTEATFNEDRNFCLKLYK
jgi:hypothetical protein